MYIGETFQHLWALTDAAGKPINLLDEKAKDTKVIKASCDFINNSISYCSLHRNVDKNEFEITQKDPTSIGFKLTADQTAKLPVGPLYVKLKLTFFVSGAAPEVKYFEKYLEDVKIGEPKRN